MNVHPIPTREQRAEHRAAQIRHFAVSTIAIVGAGFTLAFSSIPWASLSAATAALAIGLMVAPPDMSGRNRAWAVPPTPLDFVEVIAAPATDDELLAVADAVFGRHSCDGPTVTLTAPVVALTSVNTGGELVASLSNGGNGGNLTDNGNGGN